MNYKLFREQCGISTAKMIALIRARYPHYGKATQSMVDNPEKYGVCLLPEAERELLRQTYGDSVECRISTYSYAKLSEMRSDAWVWGGLTIADLLNAAVTEYIERNGSNKKES